jgi:hypothetical protein
MPTLNKHKGAPGGYYIRYGIPGSRSIGTYNYVSQHGLEILAANGISCSANGEKVGFSKALLDELKRRGLVSSNGGGFDSAPFHSAYYPEPKNDAFHLLLEEHEDDWTLMVECPKIPSSWLVNYGYRQIRQILDNEWLSVGGQKVGAQQLLPGNKVQRIQIPAQTSDILVDFSPHWPFDVSAWKGSMQGLLGTRCTLFDGENGVRLKRLRNAEQGQSTRPNHSYFVAVNPHDLEVIARSPWPAPEELDAVLVGRNGVWEAWSFSLPQCPSLTICDWLNAIGHPLQSEKWRYEIVSPPPLYVSREGSPVHNIGQHVAVCASCSLPNALSEVRRKTISVVLDGPNKVDQNSEKTLLELQLDTAFEFEAKQEGDYRLRSIIPNQCQPLHFEVVKRENTFASLVSNIQPLEVQCIKEIWRDEPPDTYEEKTSWFSMSQEATPYIIDVEMSKSVYFVFSCPTQVLITWRVGQKSDQRLLKIAPTGSVCHALNADVLQALRDGHDVNISFDAGSFGLLNFHLFPAEHTLKSQNVLRIIDHPLARQRLSWINTALLVTPRGHQDEITLDEASLRLLHLVALQESWPQLSQVAKHRRIKMSLWPHLKQALSILSPDN